MSWHMAYCCNKISEIKDETLSALTIEDRVIGSTDFGEELDDIIALLCGFQQMPCQVHLLVSGGVGTGIDPEERLQILNQTLFGLDLDLEHQRETTDVNDCRNDNDNDDLRWKFGDSRPTSCGGTITLHKDFFVTRQADVDKSGQLKNERESNDYDYDVDVDTGISICTWESDSTFPRDGIATSFVNNGPLSKHGLRKILKLLDSSSTLYLVGANADDPKKGGINQSYGNEDWISFIDIVKQMGSTIVPLPAELTRNIRIHKESSISLFQTYPVLEKVAKRTAFMFFASRFMLPKIKVERKVKEVEVEVDNKDEQNIHNPITMIPESFRTFRGHVRLNLSNRDVCRRWRQEMNLVETKAATYLAEEKATAYIETLEKDDRYFKNGVTSLDSSEGIQEILTLAGFQGAGPLLIGQKLTSTHFQMLKEIVQECLQFTFDVGSTIPVPIETAANDRIQDGGQIPTLYKDERFGFPPELKMEDNPAMAFTSSACVDLYVDAAWDLLQYITPAYDLVSAIMANRRMLTFDEGDIEGLQSAVNMATTNHE